MHLYTFYAIAQNLQKDHIEATLGAALPRR